MMGLGIVTGIEGKSSTTSTFGQTISVRAETVMSREVEVRLLGMIIVKNEGAQATTSGAKAEKSRLKKGQQVVPLLPIENGSVVSASSYASPSENLNILAEFREAVLVEVFQGGPRSVNESKRGR